MSEADCFALPCPALSFGQQGREAATLSIWICHCSHSLSVAAIFISIGLPVVNR